MILKQKVGYGI